jgi:L-fuculose-phosphate aldolase
MLLAGNGAFTLGADLSQALLRMELVEHYAKILTVARGLGTVSALAEGDTGKLLDARKKAGLGPKPPPPR